MGPLTGPLLNGGAWTHRVGFFCGSEMWQSSVRRFGLQASRPRIGVKGRSVRKCRADGKSDGEKKPGSGSGGSIVSPSVKNDWDDELGLLSTEDLQREIERLKVANQGLRNELFQASETQAGAQKEGTLDKQSDRVHKISSIPPPSAYKPQQKESPPVPGLPRIPESNLNEGEKEKMQIIFVSSEVAPWSKAGGLGDVAGSLPPALAELGHRVMVVTPRYLNGITDGLYDCAQDLGCQITLKLGQHGHQEVKFFHVEKKGVDWVFVDHPWYHRSGTPYGDDLGTFGDNLMRFSILSMAACEAALCVHLPVKGSGKKCVYGESTKFIANDWHAGLLPVYIRDIYQRAGSLMQSSCMLAIHNLAHQGIEEPDKFNILGLPGDSFGTLEWIAEDGHQSINVLKGAIATADQIVTVSPMHAWDMTTEKGAMGLHSLLSAKSNALSGVINGIDTEEWNPETDEFIYSRYSFGNMSGKQECKESLQKELEFEVSPRIPLIGFIGRLDYQKGPDILLNALDSLALESCQVVMLGSGDKEYEAGMKEKELQYRDFYRGWVGYSVPVSHKIIAGCDILLIPSRFEPCGLIQMYAMRYGTIPVAHATGGLMETIEEFNPFAKKKEMRGTGFLFEESSVKSMMVAVRAALKTFREDSEGWAAMQLAMQKDFSWENSAKKYEALLLQGMPRKAS